MYHKIDWYKIEGNVDENIVQYVNKNNIKHISVKECKSLCFLYQMPDIEGLTINSEIYGDHSIHDFDAINCLMNLRVLKVFRKSYGSIDFRNLSMLEELDIQWDRRYIDAFRLPNLKSLTVHYCDLVDLSCFSRLHQLEVMDLRSFSRLKCLDGISELKHLCWFDLSYARNLTSIRGIEALDCIESVGFLACKRISDLALLSELKSLKSLGLESMGSVETVGFLKKCLNLEQLAVVGDTSVLDGDFDFLLDLPHMKGFGFQMRKHYKRRFEEYPFNCKEQEPVNYSCKEWLGLLHNLR